MKFTNSFYEDQISESTRDFLEVSKFSYHNASEYAIHVNNIMMSPYYMNEIKNHSVELGNTNNIKLPELNINDNENLRNLYEVNLKRESNRLFTNKALSLEEISKLLQTSLFISKTREQSNIGLLHKNIASPGGLYPVELFYLNLKDEHLSLGTYFYDEESSSLKLVSKIEAKDYMSEVYKAFAVGEKMDIDIKSASGIIVLGATLNILSFKYLDRGIRWAFTEAGAITHNIQLSATAIGNIGTCPCAGFFDDFVSDLLGFKSIDQIPVLSIIIGKK